jgi:hypothetical protein
MPKTSPIYRDPTFIVLCAVVIILVVAAALVIWRLVVPPMGCVPPMNAAVLREAMSRVPTIASASRLSHPAPVEGSMAIVVPYRNRARNTNALLAYLGKTMPKVPVFIMHQHNNNQFSSARLHNIGAHLLQPHFTHILFHDADMIPTHEHDAKYHAAIAAWRAKPMGTLCLVGGGDQFADMKKRYMTHEFCGGISGFSVKAWRAFNGNSNAYEGWGGEDNERRARVSGAGLRPHHALVDVDSMDHKLVQVNKHRNWALFHRRSESARQWTNGHNQVGGDGENAVPFHVLRAVTLTGHPRALRVDVHFPSDHNVKDDFATRVYPQWGFDYNTVYNILRKSTRAGRKGRYAHIQLQRKLNTSEKPHYTLIVNKPDPHPDRALQLPRARTLYMSDEPMCKMGVRISRSDADALAAHTVPNLRRVYMGGHSANMLWASRGARVHKTRGNAISAVISDLQRWPGHKLRVAFMQHLIARRSPRVRIWGRGRNARKLMRGHRGPRLTKDGALFPYRYHIAIENHRQDGYWTEKLGDAIMAETLCFYCGPPDMTKYIDPRAYVQLPLHALPGEDPDNPTSTQAQRFEAAANIIEDALVFNLYERRLPFIRAAKYVMLRKLDIMPTMARVFAGLEDRKFDAAYATFNGNGSGSDSDINTSLGVDTLRDLSVDELRPRD